MSPGTGGWSREPPRNPGTQKPKSLKPFRYQHPTPKPRSLNLKPSTTTFPAHCQGHDMATQASSSQAMLTAALQQGAIQCQQGWTAGLAGQGPGHRCRASLREGLRQGFSDQVIRLAQTQSLLARSSLPEEKLVQDLMAKRSGVCGSSSGRGLTAAVPMSGGKPWGKYRSLNSYSYWALGFFMRNLIYSRVIYSEDS